MIYILTLSLFINFFSIFSVPTSILSKIKHCLLILGEKQGVDREGKALPAYIMGILKGISTSTIDSPIFDSNTDDVEDVNISIHHVDNDTCNTTVILQNAKNPSNRSTSDSDTRNKKTLADVWRAAGFLYGEEQSREILQVQISLPGCARLLSFPADKVQRLSTSATPLGQEVSSIERAHTGGFWRDEFKDLLDLHVPSFKNIKACSPAHNLKESESFLSLRPRDGFKASDGYVLLAADYSQIELRIMAHFSRDVGLCDAFKSGVDVFRSLASQWKGVKETEISDQQRGEVKQVCYALMYGSGA